MPLAFFSLGAFDLTLLRRFNEIRHISVRCLSIRYNEIGMKEERIYKILANRGRGVDKKEEVFLRNRKRGSAKRVIAIIKGGTWYFLRH